ncbi:MAG: type II toxin-antitoxin system CcdA family antitoxin [Betaproteobacteria bacterium]|jgi:antitoxin CcdA
MTSTTKRKTSLTLDAAALDEAKEIGINVSAVAEAALQKAISEARSRQWLADNADAFVAQANWHERHGHPLAEIMVVEGAASWRD